MKHLLAIAFITLLALGTGCAWISPTSETTSDGIKVHGHWTVTVTNPDGSVDAVREFDNALLQTGALFLTGVLTNQFTIPDIEWSVYLFAKEDGDDLSCKDSIVNPYSDYSNVSVNLPASVSLDTTIPGNPIVLSATCDVDFFSGNILIYKVQTAAKNTNNINPPLIQWTPFTSVEFGTPETNIKVQNGQTLSFNVRISFPFE